MNIFLEQLSKENIDDYLVLACDGAAWHKSEALVIPSNIRLFYLPPATPEMNPIEQIWKEIRKVGFKNETFKTLEDVMIRLCDTICSLARSTIASITGRQWILECF